MRGLDLIARRRARRERRGRDALERETICAYRVCSWCRAWVGASWRLVHMFLLSHTVHTYCVHVIIVRVL